jgi:hypothetical protein
MDAHLRRYDSHPTVLGRSDMSQLAVGRETGAWSAPNYNRRLSDKILIAFQDACEHEEFEAAAQLLRVLEGMLVRRTVYPARIRHQSREELVAAQRLLWELRHQNSRGKACANRRSRIRG